MVMHWHLTDQINTEMVADMLLWKLAQALQWHLLVERFDVLIVDFIYQKPQDYMNWLSVAPICWKDFLGNSIDLDYVSLH